MKPTRFKMQYISHISLSSCGLPVWLPFRRIPNAALATPLVTAGGSASRSALFSSPADIKAIQRGRVSESVDAVLYLMASCVRTPELDLADHVRVVSPRARMTSCLWRRARVAAGVGGVKVWSKPIDWKTQGIPYPPPPPPPLCSHKPNCKSYPTMDIDHVNGKNQCCWLGRKSNKTRPQRADSGLFFSRGGGVIPS